MYSRRQTGQWRLVGIGLALLAVLIGVLMLTPGKASAPVAESEQAAAVAAASSSAGTPADASAPAAEANPYPPGTKVRTTDGVNLRIGPTLQSPVLATITPGAELVVVEGPRDADGYRWWKVEAEDGPVRQGWMAEGWWERMNTVIVNTTTGSS